MQGARHVKEPTPDITKTGHEVRPPAKEDPEAESPGEETNRQEEMMQHPGWLLIVVGVIIAGIGAVWLLAPHIPWLGKLPGDIAVERGNFRFYFPIVTCILISVVLTGIMWLVRFLSRCPMNREEALSLLDAHLGQYRKLSYAELAAKIGHEDFPEVVGPSGTEYQMEIQIHWDHKPGGDVRVMGTIDDGTFRGAFKPVCSDLIVRADEHDVDDEP